MPEISRFCGIIIRMFPSDHPPPHFHAVYNAFEASISTETLQVIAGSLPPRILGLVVEWAQIHKKELQKNWNSLATENKFHKIKPLV